MTICKVDWKFIDSYLRAKLLKLAPNKTVDDFYFNNENKSFLVYEQEHIRPVGCYSCLQKDVGQDEVGNITIGGISLLNYKYLIDTQNFPILNDAALYISDNVWLCPNCGRWIFDFLPNYTTFTKEN